MVRKIASTIIVEVYLSLGIACAMLEDGRCNALMIMNVNEQNSIFWGCEWGLLIFNYELSDKKVTFRPVCLLFQIPLNRAVLNIRLCHNTYLKDFHLLKIKI